MVTSIFFIKTYDEGGGGFQFPSIIGFTKWQFMGIFVKLIKKENAENIILYVFVFLKVKFKK